MANSNYFAYCLYEFTLFLLHFHIHEIILILLFTFELCLTLLNCVLQLCLSGSNLIDRDITSKVSPGHLLINVSRTILSMYWRIDSCLLLLLV